MADRIGLINKGQLVQVGTPHEIYNSPCNVFVASFVGTPAINLLEARIDLAKGRASNGSLAFALTAASRERLAGLATPEDSVQLGIRPEHVRLVAEGGIAGTVYGVENHGVELIVVIDAGGHHLRATLPAKTPLALNQPVQIAFEQDKLHFFHPRSGENLFPQRDTSP
jgi:multiple sugar transport system ATP-binding protein